MADAKSFRTKELSKMTTDELKQFVKKVQGAGITGSKEVDKAINLLKVQEPSKYGAKTVESAKTSLQTQSSIPTLQKLNIAVPDWKQQQANAAAGITSTGTTGTTGTTGMSSGMTSGISSSSPFQTPEITAAQKEVDTLTAQKNQALADINDNPFYSEGTRGGKVNRLNDKYNQELSLAQNKLTAAKDIAEKAYKVQQDSLSNNREILKTYISTGALAGASEAELQQISKATGYPMGVLRGAINQIKIDQTAKLTTKQSATEKNQALINEYNQALMGKWGGDKYVSPETFLNMRNAFISEGGSLKDFNENFYTYVNPQYYEEYKISGSYFK